MYKNIPTKDGIYAALQAIENWENKGPLCPPTSWLKNLLELILYKNVFKFNDQFYIQKQGTAMGTKMARDSTAMRRGGGSFRDMRGRGSCVCI